MPSWTFDGRPALRRRGPAVSRFAAGLAAAAALLSPGPAAEATEIRTHAGNKVPACVTPERLMAFLASRNDKLEPRFREISRLYKQHGESWRIRWDYAFFQMALETNYLAFRRGDGSPGDVRPAQNNFAGLGTTGGGVRGDSYPDVSTGVLAQIQHLVAYSGERLADPVGPRTRLKQDDIVAASARLGRPVRFADLARRWATDPSYGRSIEWVAERYREAYCASAPRDAAAAAWTTVTTPPARSSLGGEPALVRPPEVVERNEHGTSAVRTVWTRERQGEPAPQPSAGHSAMPRTLAAVAAGATSAAQSKVARPVTAAEVAPEGEAETEPRLQAAEATGPEPEAAALTEAAVPGIVFSAAAVPFAAGHVVAEARHAHGTCRIIMASYGGARTALIRSTSGTGVDLVVLSVIPGFESSMAASFIRTRLPGGTVDGLFPDRDQALARARDICPHAS